MYLTRMPLNRRRRGAMKLLTDAHAMHAGVASAFPTEPGRTLWRVDRSDDQTLLYVVSSMLPDLTHIAEQAGWPMLGKGWETKPYDRFLERLSIGQTVHFRLAANPVRSIPQVGAARGKISPHVGVNNQTKWLVDRAQHVGLGLGARNVLVTTSDTVHLLRQGKKFGLARAVFEGTADVTDADSLRTVLCSGIGRGRAYGLGMLTVVPRD
jgi:CRISPR system Cascade subunit CasE